MDRAIALFFAAWAALSIAVLVPRWSLRIRRRDFFGLVPEWKFFAPIPGKGDFHLLYRDFFPEGGTEWTEIHVGGPRRWFNFFWHPRRRERKAAFDAAREMARYVVPEYIDQLEISVPYLCFLSHVSGLERTLRPEKTQFLLLYSEEGYAGGEPQVSLVSSTHELE